MLTLNDFFELVHTYAQKPYVLYLNEETRDKIQSVNDLHFQYKELSEPLHYNGVDYSKMYLVYIMVNNAFKCVLPIAVFGNDSDSVICLEASEWGPEPYFNSESNQLNPYDFDYMPVVMQNAVQTAVDKFLVQHDDMPDNVYCNLDYHNVDKITNISPYMAPIADKEDIPDEVINPLVQDHTLNNIMVDCFCGEDKSILPDYWYTCITLVFSDCPPVGAILYRGKRPDSKSSAYTWMSIYVPVKGNNVNPDTRMPLAPEEISEMFDDPDISQKLAIKWEDCIDEFIHACQINKESNSF